MRVCAFPLLKLLKLAGNWCSCVLHVLAGARRPRCAPSEGGGVGEGQPHNSVTQNRPNANAHSNPDAIGFE